MFDAKLYKKALEDSYGVSYRETVSADFIVGLGALLNSIENFNKACENIPHYTGTPKAEFVTEEAQELSDKFDTFIDSLKWVEDAWSF